LADVAATICAAHQPLRLDHARSGGAEVPHGTVGRILLRRRRSNAGGVDAGRSRFCKQYIPAREVRPPESNLIEHLLIHNPWLALALWVAAYLLDYYLTLYGARLYQSGAKEHFGFGGSYELTPYYQKEIDLLRVVSPRFVLMLALSSLAIGLVWWLAVPLLGLPEFFLLLIGGLISRQLVVIIRHIRNIVLFRHAQTAGNIQGRVEYTRRVTLRG